MSLRHVFTANPGLKLLALVLAVFLWFVAVGREEAEVSQPVPLEMINIPQNMVISNKVPAGINIRIRGAVAMIRQLANRKLRFSLDLGEAKKGPASFTLVPDDLDLPRGLEVTHLEPSVVTVELEPVITRTIRVLPVIKGEPRAGFVIEDISLEPRQIQVKGPENLVKSLDTVWTEPVDVTQLTGTSTLTTRPALPDVSLSIVGSPQIKAEIRMGEKIVTRTLDGISVQVINAASRFDIKPDKVTLTLRGPLGAMSEVVAGRGLTVSLDAGGLGPGSVQRGVVVSVPGHIDVLKVVPDQVKITIHEEMPTTGNGQ
ncbi:MAG: hypothetical protein KKB20_29380 [Proteobacteria bacterium]|nr:hypothetical protein [Pseudomonadota bacterium]